MDFKVAFAPVFKFQNDEYSSHVAFNVGVAAKASFTLLMAIHCKEFPHFVSLKYGSNNRQGNSSFPPILRATQRCQAHLVLILNIILS